MITSVGNPVGLFYGYKTAGVFSTDAEAKAAGNGDYLYMENAAGNRQNFVAGDVHFVDMTGEGKIDENDRVVIAAGSDGETDVLKVQTVKGDRM